MSNLDLVRTTQALGLTTSLFFAGIYFSASQLTLPILYRLPKATSASIFDELYHRGAVVAVPFAAVSTLSFGTTAYLLPNLRTEYATAAGLVASTMVWTLTVMMSVNGRLIEVNQMSEVEKEKVTQQEVEGLLRRWAWMNFVRSALAGAAGMVGGWALMKGL